MTTPPALTLANRLRWRARLLRLRSGEVVEKAPADQLAAALARGCRLHERARRADRRADRALTPAAA